MNTVETIVKQKKNLVKWRTDVLDEQQNIICKGVFQYSNTRYGNDFVKTVIAAGIETPVEYRRGGNVRKLFVAALEKAKEDGMAVSLLHPFSFPYYQKFGYEKVSDHLIVRFPITKLDFVDRCSDFKRFTNSPEQVQDLLQIYNTFACGRNLLRERVDEEYYAKEGLDVFIYYEDGQPTGYISFTTKKVLVINHFEQGVMYIKEVGYTTPAAVRAILGFIRMYEGELEEVEFSDLAFCPEIEMTLRYYMHTSYRFQPDIMARVLNTQVMLEAHTYPSLPGSFRIEVTDPLGLASGKFAVEYDKGQGKVCPLSEDAAVDLRTDVSTFSRIIYGYDGLTSRAAALLPQFEIFGNADGFFDAFPKAVGGAWEHF